MKSAGSGTVLLLASVLSHYSLVGTGMQLDFEQASPCYHFQNKHMGLSLKEVCTLLLTYQLHTAIAFMGIIYFVGHITDLAHSLVQRL